MTKPLPPCTVRPSPPDDASGVAALMRMVTVQSWRCGQDVWGADMPLGRIHYLIAGRVTVLRQSLYGHWTPIYRVCAPDSATAAPVVLVASDRFETRCVADVDATAIIVRTLDFDRLLEASQTFRAFALQAYATRIAGLIDDIAERLNPRTH